jgi:hypothetical protein
MIAVPKTFPGSTIVCVGGGPSLTVADVDACYGVHVHVLAINDAWRLAPWADVLYACDQKWWTWHQGVPQFAGPKYAIAASDPITWPDVQVLENTGVLGLELAPTGLRTGYNSGYQAINLAVHLGATRILLLGYDLGPAPDGRTHWFGEHPDRQPSPYPVMREAFASLVEPLAALGVTVVNCSRRTALGCFRCAPLEDELALARVQHDLEQRLVDGHGPQWTPAGITA